MIAQSSASLRKHWADRFIPSYKQILGTHLEVDPFQIRTADYQEDCQEATDLVLPDGRRIACKTRRASILLKYPDEFALRSRAPEGYQSEWAKIRSGMGDLLLYTYSDEAEKTLEQWRLFDLDVLRAAQRSWFEDCKRPQTISVPDQEVYLISFNWRQIAPKYGCILLGEGTL